MRRSRETEWLCPFAANENLGSFSWSTFTCHLERYSSNWHLCPRGKSVILNFLWHIPKSAVAQILEDKELQPNPPHTQSVACRVTGLQQQRAWVHAELTVDLTVCWYSLAVSVNYTVSCLFLLALSQQNGCFLSISMNADMLIRILKWSGSLCDFCELRLRSKWFRVIPSKKIFFWWE